MNGVQPVSGEWASSFDLPVQHVAPEPQRQEPKPPAKLSIVLPFVGREVPRVIQLLDWMAQLSGQLNRSLYLLPFKGVDIQQVTERALKAFTDVQVITDSEGVTSDWTKDEKIRDAAGPNSLFRQAAWFFQLKPIGPWLYLEPDCVPLTEDWDKQLETAYRACGKLFFGAMMKAQGGETYLNGVAIYPKNAVAVAGSLATRTMWTQFPELEIAFDVAGGRDVLRQAHITDLIQLEYRSDGAQVPSNSAVLFHGDRTGQLLASRISAGGREAVKPTGVSPISPEPKRVSIRAKACAGSNPARQPAPKRKRGDAKCTATVDQPSPTCTTIGVTSSAERPMQQSNGAEPVLPSSAPVFNGSPMPIHPKWFEANLDGSIDTIGDRIRRHVGALESLATNANRKTRIVAQLRKSKLIPRR